MPTALWLQGHNASERLERIHDHLLLSYPWVDRIACALYHDSTGLLKTFINSTHRGQAIVGYEYPMSDSPVLSQLADTGQYRVIDDIKANILPENSHSRWLLEQDYNSSFTVPLYDEQRFLGFFIPRGGLRCQGAARYGALCQLDQHVSVRRTQCSAHYSRLGSGGKGLCRPARL
ncbi:hypothetical protein [Shewanella algae]|uniref:hypothetical protein n=1 Tax=Shewanella algae TaxID=38313 RepID=UPI0021B3BD68|nr:hypothetical protein [Shewanella algae]